MKILIVDPDVVRVPELKLALAANGAEVTVASSGSFALTMLEWNRHDLVVSRARIDDMDGHELCAILKSDPGTRDVSFVLVAGNDKITAAQTTAAGVDLVLPPTLPAGAMVPHVLRLVQGDPAPAAPRPAPAPAPPAPVVRPAAPPPVPPAPPAPARPAAPAPPRPAAPARAATPAPVPSAPPVRSAPPAPARPAPATAPAPVVPAAAAPPAPAPQPSVPKLPAAPPAARPEPPPAVPKLRPDPVAEPVADPPKRYVTATAAAAAAPWSKNAAAPPAAPAPPAPINLDAMPSGTFQGSLEVMDLAELTQAIAMGGKNGRLILALPQGGGVVAFEAGRVVHAEYRGTVGETAFAALLTAAQADAAGRFCFLPSGAGEKPSPSHTIDKPVDRLLLSIATAMDEKG